MLNPDYREMLQCFARHEVRYLVVGAYALAAHGFPRSTADIDLWVRPDPDNARRTYQALADFGAPVMQINEATFTTPEVVFQIGVAPCRIDLLTSISGNIDFDEAEVSCVSCTLDGVPVRVLSIETLIANKLATGRPRDLTDVAMLRRSRG